jgi:hypothetical protein
MTGSTRSVNTSVTDELESEFRDVYRAPGARYLGVIGLFGGVGALAFYLTDALSDDQPWIGGAQSLRLALAFLYLLVPMVC